MINARSPADVQIALVQDTTVIYCAQKQKVAYVRHHLSLRAHSYHRLASVRWLAIPNELVAYRCPMLFSHHYTLEQIEVKVTERTCTFAATDVLL